MNRHRAKSQNSRTNIIENSDWYYRGDYKLPNEILTTAGLPELDTYQQSAVEDVHLIISKGLYKNDLGNLFKMNRAMKNTGISKEQIRVLVEKGITGEYAISPKFIEEVTNIESDIARTTLHDYLLDNINSRELSIEQLVAVLNTNTDIKDYSDLLIYLALCDIEISNKNIYDIAMRLKNEFNKHTLINNRASILRDDIFNLSENGSDIGDLFIVFISKGNKREISKFFDSINRLNLEIPKSILSKKCIETITTSNTIDKADLAKFITNLIDKDLSKESLEYIDEFLKSRGLGLYAKDYSNDMLSRIKKHLANIA